MGFSAAWMAFPGVPKARALALAGLRDTGTPSPYLEAPYSAGEQSNGWTVLFTDLIRSADFMFASPEQLEILSRDHAVLGFMVEDHAVVAASYYYLRGECVWQVTYSSEEAVQLATQGTLPPEFVALKARAVADPRSGLAENELPADLAEAVCGFRHDKVHTAQFTVAERA